MSRELFTPEDREEMREQLARVCSEARAVRHLPSDDTNRYMGEATICAYDEGKVEVGLAIVYLGQAMSIYGADVILSSLMEAVAISAMHPTIAAALTGRSN